MKQFDNRIVEQYIKVDTAYRLKIRRILIYAGIVVLGVLVYFGMTFLSFRYPALTGTPITIALFAVVIAFLATRKLTKRQYVEFEYSFVNGLMSIARITDKEKRKDQPGFDCENVTVMSHKYDPTRGGGRQFANIYDYSASEDGEGLWYFQVDRHESGRALFILEPNETMLAALREFVPRGAVQD